MDDIFTQCREGNAVAVRLWLDNTENDLNQGRAWLPDPNPTGPNDVCRRLVGSHFRVRHLGSGPAFGLGSVKQHDIELSDPTDQIKAHQSDHRKKRFDATTISEVRTCSKLQFPIIYYESDLICICSKYGETPLDKGKIHLRELLKERAEKLGQSLTKVPYKDTFWKGTTRTRPRNGTLNKHAGIDFKQLTLNHKINENHSGELWKGRWQGNDIVIKVLKVRDWTTRKSRDFNEEYPKLRIFSHPNVLPVLGACQSPPAPHPIIITHWMPYGSLYNVLHEGTNFVVDQTQAVKFALDIARGLAFLHTLEPLIPRHYVNSKSIMIDEDMTARISMADVKFSFQCPGRMYAPAWVAPEALQKKPEEINRRSADMWSFAILLWELVTREVPFADLSNMEIGMKVSLEGLRPTIPPGISPHICKLMKICMNEDPAKRPKFDMIVPIMEKMQDK
ncbi:integrin-linked protein kinase [Heterodontus francisci]|uniref:integrin-linked protein kinase n=1 Tax=Heterodontus francisci TaxID=7792 RepID=UPI00355C1ACA